jgi:hypothetical protein
VAVLKRLRTAASRVSPDTAMSEDPDTKPADDNEAIEREIRAKRQFSMSEAIGRVGGGDVMKGGSPVSRKLQAELEIEEYLHRHLADSGGVLKGVLLRHLEGGLLECDYTRPLAALAEYIPQVLASEPLLQEVVREADAEWGRALGERPYFQKPGRPAHPDDPYTVDSVRLCLFKLRDRLASGDTST